MLWLCLLLLQALPDPVPTPEIIFQPTVTVEGS